MNARVDRDPPERRNSTITFKTLKGSGAEWWVMVDAGLLKKRLNAYMENIAWLKSMENITKELSAKAYIYNMLINLQS